MACLLNCEKEKLPKEIMVAFEPQKEKTAATSILFWDENCSGLFAGN